MLSTISESSIGDDMYHLLEKVIETATPLEFKFKGKKLLISLTDNPKNVGGKLANLEPHPECLVGDPEDIVHLDWSKEIHYDLP
jgi:hypothetical protein